MADKQINYVSLLNVLSQKEKVPLNYKLLSSDGPDHIKTFTMQATLNGKTYPAAVGKSMKEAKYNAAKNVLSAIQEQEDSPATSSIRGDCTSPSVPSFTQPNYTCWLNEYCQRNKVFFHANEKTKINPENQCYWYGCKYVCEGREFPEAVCKGRKEAKEEAAKLVYEELMKEQNNEVPGENGTSSQNPSSSLCRQNISSPSGTKRMTVDKNFVGLLNQHCQKTKQPVNFTLVEKSGPAHNSQFVYRVIINKKQYPEGRGMSVKDAKQQAAQLALRALQPPDEASAPADETPLHSTEIDSEDSDSVLSEPPSTSTDEFIVFQPSPSDQNLVPLVKQMSPVDAKAKRKIAANFHHPPDGRIETNSPKQAPAPAQTPKSRFVDEFDEIKGIGKGGFGRVFKARLKLDKKCYAVKIVKSTEKALREVNALADLVHPNIVRYHTSWIEETAFKHEDESADSSSATNDGGESIYIKMEFCEGKTLRDWIDEKNSQDKNSTKQRPKAMQIMQQVLEAVEYIHSVSLIHRDLKPLNILFDRNGVVKIGDFGLVTAAVLDSDEATLKRTVTGTRSYMSPEQENDCSYNHKVDIFSLGLIYFELLWCITTWCERSKIWGKIREKTFPEQFKEKFPFEHKHICQMLSVNPNERPEARALLQELHKLSSLMDPNQNLDRKHKSC